MGTRTVLQQPDITRALTRIAHEILEANHGASDLVLLGIPTRGAVLAERLDAVLADIEPEWAVDREQRVGTLDVTMHRDDLGHGIGRAPQRTTIPTGGVDGKVVVLVDDVLYSGRTVRAALDALQGIGRPRAVRLAVLVDRGHRELPIRADHVGKNLPTASDERVTLRLTETDGADEVVIEQPDTQGGRGVKHLLSTADLSRAEAIHILDVAEEMAEVNSREVRKLPALRGKTVVNLFFEDSTRTRISFEAAAKRLSADVINFAAKGSSVSKGESLKDTVQTLGAMGIDGIVIRHGASGAPRVLADADWIDVPVVNAGDGTHEHPTQALLDAFTMRRRLHGAGSRGQALDGVRVVIVGDVLHSRVARSNAWLLRTLGAEVTFVAPPTLLPAVDRPFGAAVHHDLDVALAEDPDVVMLLRIQQERMHDAFFPNEREYTRHFGLTAARATGLSERTLIMHPGPMNRGLEIAGVAADDPRSTVVEQVANGVSVRMAVLYLALTGDHDAKESVA